jgi:hypothetical protein
MNTSFNFITLTMDWDDIRQLRYPPEFRIPKPKWSSVEEIRGILLTLLSTPAGQPRPTEDATKLEGLALQIGNALWRIQQRFVDRSSGKLREEYKKLARHVESISEALGTVEVQIQDHTNQRFVTGLALDVIAFEPCEDIDQEIVIETVAPSIYVGDKKLQTGKVIVGTPAA